MEELFWHLALFIAGKKMEITAADNRWTRSGKCLSHHRAKKAAKFLCMQRRKGCLPSFVFGLLLQSDHGYVGFVHLMCLWGHSVSFLQTGLKLNAVQRKRCNGKKKQKAFRVITICYGIVRLAAHFQR